MKAISTVIAALLMLIITIALAGFAYTYISGTFSSKTAQTFSVVDSFGDTVTISNDGTEAITSFQRATLDGNPVNVAIVPNVGGLVGYWSFNEGSGSVAKDSVSNNDGTLTNGPIWVDGRYGKAIQFDGVDDYMNKDDSPSLHSDRVITITGWFFVNSFDKDWQSIYWKGNTPDCTTGCENREYTLWLNRAGYLHLTSTPSDRVNIGELACTTTSGTIATGQWYHFASVISSDGNFMRTYTDGVQRISCGYSTSNIRDTTGALRIGNNPSWSGQFNGIIDEVAIFNRALSESEVKQLFSGLILPGQSATIKPLTSLSPGTHTLRLCTSSMCTTTLLTIT